MSTLEVIATIGIAVIAAAPGILAFLEQRKKTTVDVAERYETMAAKQVEQIEKLRQRIDAMEGEIDALQCDIEARDKVIFEWQAGISLLVNQLTANRMEPVWTPKSAPPTKRSKTQ